MVKVVTELAAMMDMQPQMMQHMITRRAA